MTSPSLSPSLLVAASCAALLLGTSCKKEYPATMEITQSRKVFADETEIPEPAKSSVRLGLGTVAKLDWTVPDDWRLMPSDTFRQLNFAFGPANEGECYFSQLDASRAGALENINRWRKQVGQEPLDEAGLAALPKAKLFNREVPLVDVSGTYTPAMQMSGQAAEPKPNYRIVGLLVEAPEMGAILTVKMVGPQELVEKNLPAFHTFANSLTVAK
jgi:hypothetical protein